MADLEVILIDAEEAARQVCMAWFVRNYIGGDRVIEYREPNDQSYWYSSFHSWDYARVAGVTTGTALKHLRKLVEAGHVLEENRGGPRFRLTCTAHDVMGREVIAALVAEGLPFEDDWRRARQAANG